MKVGFDLLNRNRFLDANGWNCYYHIVNCLVLNERDHIIVFYNIPLILQYGISLI